MGRIIGFRRFRSYVLPAWPVGRRGPLNGAPDQVAAPRSDLIWRLD